MKLLVISPSPNREKAERMIATARRVGIEPVIYGETSRHTHGKDYQGSDIVQILQTRTDAEIVMGVDAFDVAFLAGEDEILAKFDQFKYLFVMSAELEGVSGLRKTKEELHRQCLAEGGLFPQPNMGGWIGEREYALYCFNEAERLYKDHPEDPNYSYDNHYQWLTMMKAWGGVPFEIDIHCRLFQSANRADLKRLDTDAGKRLFNRATNTFPSVIHYNGDPTRGAYNELVEWILS